MQMNDLTFFLRSLNGRCHGNQFCGQISEIGLLQLIALAFQNGLELQLRYTAIPGRLSLVFATHF